MEILTEVDARDIGEIAEGQGVRFEVTAYSDQEFAGRVKQVRLQPRTISNVVTYTAVVEAENPKGLLLPGMTATVDFITDKRSDVLLVPARALRFQPPAEVLAAYREKQQERFANREGGGENRGGGGHGAMSAGGPGGRFGGDHGGRGFGGGNFGMVWYLDSLGQFAAAPLRTGLTDGSNTEVVGSRVLVEGMEIIVGTTSGDRDARDPMLERMRRMGGSRGHGPGF